MMVNFGHILNFRDVSGIVNLTPHHSNPRLKPGILFRASRPDAATESLLHENYNIQTIIDLRSSADHMIERSYSAILHLALYTIIPQSSTAITTRPEIPGINYVNISLYGKAFERALVRKMTWSNMAKLVGYIATGYLTEGISLVGRSVMQPRGLIGLGFDTLQHSGREIKEIFNILAHERSYPVIIHCTQGKDRTGIVVLLILVLCGVDLETVTADYVRSETELKPDMEEWSRYLGSLGLDDSFAGCPANFVEKIVAHIDIEYDGIVSYFNNIGVDEATQKKVKQILME
jgi:protein-tyrosine phosphatase